MATNIAELQKELFEVFNGLRDGTVDIKDAVEINNTAGKISGTVKLQLTYAQMRKEVPEIAVMK